MKNIHEIAFRFKICLRFNTALFVAASICEPCESCDVSPKTALDDEMSKEVVLAEVEVWDEDGPVLCSGSSSMVGNVSSPDNVTKKTFIYESYFFFVSL